jgi:hypothetical protein
MNKILVIGIRRSGTTVLGQLLNFAPQKKYLSDPFNCHVWMHNPINFAYLGKFYYYKKEALRMHSFEI